MKFTDVLQNLEKQFLTEMAYGYSHLATKISSQQLVEKIKTLTTPDVKVFFTSVTDATYKKGNPLGTIFKVSQVEGLINVDYAKRKQETLDTTAPGQKYVATPNYGTHITPALLAQGPKMFIQVLPEKAQSPRYIVRDSIGRFSEKDKATVQPFLSPGYPSKSTDVLIRRYGILSIVAIEIDGHSYEITVTDPDRTAVLNLINSTPQKTAQPVTPTTPPQNDV